VSASIGGDELKPPLLRSSSYPSQELNPRYGDFKLKSEEGVEFSPGPPRAKALFCPKKVTSMATGLSQDLSDLTTNGDRASSSLLDSFEIDGMGAEPIARWLESENNTATAEAEEGTGNNMIPPRVSNSPEDKLRRKRKGKTKKVVTYKPNKKVGGVLVPSKFDILRGRGGQTNRHVDSCRASTRDTRKPHRRGRDRICHPIPSKPCV
jgi:hypothetical protein